MAQELSKKIQDAISEALHLFEEEQQDPRFLVIGATGAGKSSVINRIFRTELHKVNDVESTTRSFITSNYAVEKTTIRITDSPGYGEVGHDDEYSRDVVAESRKSHVMVLVLKADEKGYQRDLDMVGKVFANPEFDHAKPLIIALNQIDKLPPVREWSPPYDLMQPVSAEDSDKVKHIKEKLALVRSQFRNLSKSGEIILLPVMAEPREGTLFGIDVLRECLFDVLPEVAQLKYARASRIAEGASKELIAKLDKRAQVYITGGATAAAAAVMVNPVPISDWIILVPLQIGMVVKIGAIYGRTLNQKSAKETVMTLGAGFAARTIFQGLISMLPIIKNFIGPPFAAAATYGIGVGAQRYFKSGAVPSVKEIEEAATSELKRRGG